MQKHRDTKGIVVKVLKRSAKLFLLGIVLGGGGLPHEKCIVGGGAGGAADSASDTLRWGGARMHPYACRSYSHPRIFASGTLSVMVWQRH